MGVERSLVLGMHFFSFPMHRSLFEHLNCLWHAFGRPSKRMSTKKDSVSFYFVLMFVKHTKRPALVKD